MGEFLSQIKKSQITEFRLHATYTVDEEDEFHETMEVPATPSSGDQDGSRGGGLDHSKATPTLKLGGGSSGGNTAAAGGQGGFSAMVGVWILLVGVLIGMVVGEKLQIQPVQLLVELVG